MSKAYAYRNLSSIYNESTSGGAFTKFVNSFFLQGGDVVYGATMTDNVVVKHERAISLSDCGRFRKSKYVRSSLNGIFQMVENDINNNLKVLFTGTPCQISALNKFLDKNHLTKDSLYTIDVICNGAPSPDMWKNFVMWIEAKQGRRLISFDFRKKGDKNNPYLTEAVFSDGTRLCDSPQTACWNRLFLKKLIIPPMCFSCPFKKEDRVSDITLGDFWGSGKIFTDHLLREGVSLILVNSEKGECLFDYPLHGDNAIIKKCENKEYLKYQGNLMGITCKPKHYDHFWNDYKERGFGYVANKYADADFPKSIKYKLRYYYRFVKNMFD